MSLHRFALYSLIRNALRTVLSTAAIGSLLLSSAVSAAPITIDDFNQPNPEQFYVIAAINADPLLHKTAHPSILGGERDLLVDVIGSAALTTAGPALRIRRLSIRSRREAGRGSVPPTPGRAGCVRRRPRVRPGCTVPRRVLGCLGRGQEADAVRGRGLCRQGARPTPATHIGLGEPHHGRTRLHPPGRPGPDQHGDRGTPVHLPSHGQSPPRPHLPKARRQ